MQLSAWNSTISKFQIFNSSGTSSKINSKWFYFSTDAGVSSSFFTVQNSRQVAIKDVTINNCAFNSVRALQLISSNQTSISNLSITASEVTTNHIIYLSHVFDTIIEDSIVRNITKKQSLQSKTLIRHFHY